MASSSQSASPPPDRKKKDKKKEEKKKDKKEKKDKSRGRSRSPRRDASEEQPRSRLAELEARAAAEPRGVGGRSRSRDEPRDNFAELFAAEFGKGGDGGKGDGKGNGKGKGKDGGKGGKGDGYGAAEGEDAEPKEEPNFEASGLLAMEDNSKNGIPLKFTQPAEARLPATKWRLYIFTKQKGSEASKVVHIHRQMGYLFGKDRRVVDIPTDHPTCSKQHAVMHYRLTGSANLVKPYLMDLESTNGTFLNGERLEHARYYEMREGDVMKFGMSSREFVLLHGASANGMQIDPALLRTP
mmetsp:Transcript_64686/g.169385  ORF Transcript_64686/g.169385 Transcript_64686/m.169385 type:complete len:297 (-) Transcript_64686:173-1063(-)